MTPPTLGDLPVHRAADTEELKRELERQLRAAAVAAASGAQVVVLADALSGALALGEPAWPEIPNFDWSSGDQVRALVARLDVANRLASVPALLALLPDGADRLDRQCLSLLDLGFLDALRPRTLCHLAREYGSIRAGLVGRALDRAETALRGPPLLAARAGVGWGLACASAVWDAANAEDIGHVELLDEVLGRADTLADAGSPMARNMLLELLVIGHAQDWRLGCRLTTDGFELSADSLAGEVWRRVLGWSTTDAARDAARARAFRRALLHIELVTKDQADWDPRVRSLVHANAFRAGPVPFEDPALEAFAILSGHWGASNPIGAIRIDKLGLSLEDLLEQATTALLHSAEDPELDQSTDGRWINLRLPTRDTRVPIQVPVEAVVARCPPDRRPDLLRELAKAQGAHDARLAASSLALSKAPGSETALAAYLRGGLGSPFRTVREDASEVASWGASEDAPDRPDTLDDLRALLGEPGPLPSDDLVAEIRSRFAEGGAWAEAPQVREMFEASFALPGLLAALRAVEFFRAADEASLREAVTAAWRRLETPNDWSAGRLSADLALVRTCAVRAEILDDPERTPIRDALPGLVARLVAALRSPAPPETLASLEPKVLELCGAAVRRLSVRAPGTTERDLLWLTWRLAGWMELQIHSGTVRSREASMATLRRVDVGIMRAGTSDLLDPARLGPDKFDHRLAVILALLILGGRTLPDAPDRTPDERLVSQALSRELAMLAARQPTAEEERFRHRAGPTDPSLFGWGVRLTAVPDLALHLLLTIDPEGARYLADDIVIRWFDSGLAAADDSPIRSVVWGLAAAVARAPTREDNVLRRLDGLARSEQVPVAVRAHLLVFAYAGGRASLPTAVDQLARCGTHPAWRTIVTDLLRAVSERAPSELRPVLEEVGRTGPSMVEVILALAPVAAESALAREVLGEISVAHMDDPAVREVRTVLGLGAAP